MRGLKILGVLIGVLSVIYFLGPRPSTPQYQSNIPNLPDSLLELQDFIHQKELAHPIKPGNESKIIWADSTPQQTNYAIVYLHGFSASHEEGNPVHQLIAKQFHCNLYLSRLAEHGLDTADAMINLTPEKLWESAKEAYAIGKRLGKKVILMGTSTGGSLALQLAAQFPEVAGLILISPNIQINDPNAWLLNNPWGLQIARAVLQSNYNGAKNCTPEYAKYWYCKYRIEAAVALEEYLETAMVEQTFKAVKQPTLTLAYYKNEKEQDPVVRVDAMQKMMQQLGTSSTKKQLIFMPHTGNHVQGSALLSKDVEGVVTAIQQFLPQIIQ